MVTVSQVAQICHEANRAYCETIGDFTQPPWNLAPAWQMESAIKGVNFHLRQLEEGLEPDPSASHEAWMREKVRDGWIYGPVKDPDRKQHPCLVAYDKLPVEQRLKDYIFAGIVKSFFDAEVTHSFAEAKK